MYTWRRGGEGIRWRVSYSEQDVVCCLCLSFRATCSRNACQNILLASSNYIAHIALHDMSFYVHVLMV